jgi:hypothetical protein
VSPWALIADAGLWTSSFPWRENSVLNQFDAKMSWVKGRSLWYAYEANDAPYVAGDTLQNAAGLAQSYRPFTNQYFAGITRTSDIGYSNYNSLQVTARKRFSAGYTMQLAYTFSKSLDTGSFADSDGATYQDPNPTLPAWTNLKQSSAGVSSPNPVHRAGSAYFRPRIRSGEGMCDLINDSFEPANARQ